MLFFLVVRFGATHMIYVGQSNENKKPHGTGYLYFPNGDLHEGSFDNGRAHGEVINYISISIAIVTTHL